ncbi:hypothetical protein CANARDRAFT_29630 [[Candida] arabinofermentans NRRL YB-2248]|uniref:Class E vacuolar protein-sorting machinery protein HSE1 n=1 Tax=[Candida] arabinofermentans NRRL YB-2248 TaxID=983967 RepID=A0A1E4SWR8_9ASCO|nr:hypothetical protein CANARDRAFT_29630 [[Candida] arabinofermentans NRRL YB-2248]
MSLRASIDKATSAELTEDDYGLLLDVVDTVKTDPDTNIEEAISIMKQKLETKNANVILRTITLVDFLAENCGAMMRGEIAKKSFVNNYMVKLLNDDSMHSSVKYAIIKEIYKLSKTFKGDESLKIMGEIFKDLKNSYLYLCQQAINEVDGKSVSVAAPSADLDEDEELKKAIELSLKDSQRPFPNIQPQQTSQPVQQVQVQNPTSEPIQNQPLPEEPVQQPSPDKVIALFDLSTEDPDTLAFKKDDIITIIEKVNEQWFRGCLHGKLGIIPYNYVKKISKTSSAEIDQLTKSLDESFNVEVFLSKLMSIKAELAKTPMSNKDFEQMLIKDEIPSTLDNILKKRSDLKSLLDLLKLRILELESIDDNISSSTQIYQNLLNESKQSAQQQPVNQQMANLSINQDSPSQFGNTNLYSNNPYLQSSYTGSVPSTYGQSQSQPHPQQQPQETGVGFQYSAPPGY